MAIYYIGSFPPAYGGVTIKNQNLYEALKDQLDLRKIDMNRIKRGDIREILRFGWAMLTGKQYIIGLAGQKNRRQFTKLMYRFKRKAMSRSVLLVMSGIVDDVIGAGADFLRMFNSYRKTYVELPGMRDRLEQAGVTNAAVYPNARPRPRRPEPVRTGDGPLRCVFFSQIEPDKGVDRILAASMLLPEFRFDFYGRIVPNYREKFQGEMVKEENTCYHGVFTGDANAVYEELSRFDVLLLPTRCKTEGLPGILIEAKIAGIPAVVSATNHNREIVSDGTDGFVLVEDSVQCLVSALRRLDGNREMLLRMKQAARESAESYYIDVCAQSLIRDLLER